MMPISPRLSRLSRLVHRFRDDSRGSLTVEAVVILPILFWAMLAMLVFFDGYRQSSLNIKAAYTIGDMLSREVDPIDNAYLNGLYQLQQQLARSANAPKMRVTVARYDGAKKEFRRDWSHQRGGVTALSDNDVRAMTDRLPAMPNNERVILVETWADYEPPFNVGLKRQDLYNFVFTRPRFAPQLVFES